MELGYIKLFIASEEANEILSIQQLGITTLENLKGEVFIEIDDPMASGAARGTKRLPREMLPPPFWDCLSIPVKIQRASQTSKKSGPDLIACVIVRSSPES